MQFYVYLLLTDFEVDTVTYTTPIYNECVGRVWEQLQSLADHVTNFRR